MGTLAPKIRQDMPKTLQSYSVMPSFFIGVRQVRFTRAMFHFLNVHLQGHFIVLHC
jgi:hypothetical protein